MLQNTTAIYLRHFGCQPKCRRTKIEDRSFNTDLNTAVSHYLMLDSYRSIIRIIYYNTIQFQFNHISQILIILLKMEEAVGRIKFESAVHLDFGETHQLQCHNY